MILFGRRVLFSSPKPCDVLIFDECNSQHVCRVINKKHSTGVFNMRPEDIFFGMGVMVQFSKELLKFSLEEVRKNHRGFLHGVIKQVYYIYLKACLESIKPKAVITFIDTSSVFGLLAKHCDNFPFIAIQNGSRLSYAALPDSNYYVPHYYVPHYFCFGNHEKTLFPKLGYQVDHYYPVGSLVASLHFLPEDQLEDKYDMLIVSTWRGSSDYVQNVLDTMRSMKIMDQLLTRYIKNHEIKAALIYRTMRDCEGWIIPEIGLSEEEYYQEIYGDSIKHIDNSDRNIFPLMQQSKMVITCLSTAGIEAYGLGKKLLYCNFTGTDLYHQDIADEILTKNSEYTAFSEILDQILSMKQEEYLEEHKERMQYYMNFDAENSVESRIEAKFDEIIENFR